MKIETKRLILIPLNYDQLIKYLKSDNSLESELGLALNKRVVPDVLVDAFTKTILPAVRVNEDKYLFSTLWTIVLKSENTMVGDLCFKGVPNNFGEIEIGYGTYESFQGKGYMSEAIHSISNWAFTQSGVNAIIAETESSNISSHKVLKNNGFYNYQTIDNIIWWRLDRKNRTH